MATERLTRVKSISNTGDNVETKMENETETLNDYPNAHANANEVDDLMVYWKQAGGSKLNLLLISKLEALAKKYDVDSLKKAINAANSGANSTDFGISLEYVETKLTKGSEKFGKADRTTEKAPTQIDYGAEPDYSWLD